MSNKKNNIYVESKTEEENQSTLVTPIIYGN